MSICVLLFAFGLAEKSILFRNKKTEADCIYRRHPRREVRAAVFWRSCLRFSAKFGKKKEKNRYDDVNGKKLRSFEPIAFAVSTDQDNDTNSQREG